MKTEYTKKAHSRRWTKATRSSNGFRCKLISSLLTVSSLADGHVLRGLQEQVSSVGNDSFDLTTCPTDLVLHDIRSMESNQYAQESSNFHQSWLNNDFREHFQRSPETTRLLNHPRDMIETIPSGGNLIFWRMNWAGSHLLQPELDMSLFNGSVADDRTLSNDAEVVIGSSSAGVHTWNLIDPVDYSSKHHVGLAEAAKNKIHLPEGPKEYIFFASVWYTEYQHILIDHLGYWSYLVENFPEAHFIFPKPHDDLMMYAIIRMLDRNLSNRVTFLECEFSQCGTQMLVAPPTSSLSVFMPKVPTRNLDLLERARKWVWETSHVRPPAEDEEKVIIYYKRLDTAKTNNGRIMDQDQDETIIEMIKHAMTRYNRPERLVVFDGSDLKFVSQLNLFRSASMVIGPHGGLFANLILTPPVTDCNKRPKVIEFVKSSETPHVQFGEYELTYYNLYSTMPWVELHQVFFVEPSTKGTTYIDLRSFADALNSVMGGDAQYATSLTSPHNFVDYQSTMSTERGMI